MLLSYKGKIMKLAGKQMKLEKIMLSEVTKAQKDKCCISLSYMGPGFEF